jgi:hypothetical protein
MTLSIQNLLWAMVNERLKNKPDEGKSFWKDFLIEIIRY